MSPTVAELSRERLRPQRGQVSLLSGPRSPSISGPERVDHAASGQLDGLEHVDAQVLDRLEPADYLTELLSHFGVSTEGP